MQISQAFSENEMHLLKRPITKDPFRGLQSRQRRQLTPAFVRKKNNSYSVFKQYQQKKSEGASETPLSKHISFSNLKEYLERKSIVNSEQKSGFEFKMFSNEKPKLQWKGLQFQENSCVINLNALQSQ